MESLIQRFFLYQWQRKLITLLTATLIWIFVNHTITSTKIVPSIPIRLINMPADKTVQGLLPNGFLLRRMTLTLSGTKDVIEQIEPGDLEVIIDASILPNEAAIQVTKKNLISLNPNINLSQHIASVSNSEFVLKMSPLVTEKIPILIQKPIGVPPDGYEFLDIWPQTLFQTVSGPHDQVVALKNQGVEITFNLDEITQDQLDALSQKNPAKDEIGFIVPDDWKKVVISFAARSSVAINDPEERLLQINFLRKSLIPLKNFLPINIYYPTKYSHEVNPENHPLQKNPFITFENEIPLLATTLYATGISKVFLDVVKDFIELQIIALPPNESDKLDWAIGFVGEKHLMERYIAVEFASLRVNPMSSQIGEHEHEKQFRGRFDYYKENLTLYLKSELPLMIESAVVKNGIEITIPNLSSSQRSE